MKVLISTVYVVIKGEGMYEEKGRKDKIATLDLKEDDWRTNGIKKEWYI